MKSRYCFNPMAGKRVGFRLNPFEKFSRWAYLRRKRKEERMDVFTVTGYWA